nr:hypothetical protein [Dechloromonas sp.]
MPRLVPEVFAYHRSRAAAMRRAAIADFFEVLISALRRTPLRLFRLVFASSATRTAIH